HPKESKVTSTVSLEERLAGETFLAGQRVTLADVAVCCGMLALGSPGETGPTLPSALARWMGTCLNQPQFRCV
ncbi:unnamed protein product, partial [Laminaria digitata]